MKYLFDINVLLALAHEDHSDHDKVCVWISSISKIGKEFNTCAITELGFVRISVQAGLQRSIIDAKDALADIKRSSPVPFVLISDNLGVATMPKYVKSPGQLTDGHLLELASAYNAKLVTLDTGITGALLIE